MDILRLGAEGPQVELLQLGLVRAGYEMLKNGIFNDRTLRAVCDFQARCGLEADGVVGGLTWRTLGFYIMGYAKVSVCPGDTFESIAQAYRTDIERIRIANPGVEENNLAEGMALTVPLNYPVVATDISFSSQLLKLTVQGLAARYPFIKKGIVGKSVMGRPLHVLRMGQGKAHLGLSAAHHGNEWVTAPLVLKFLEEYAESFSRELDFCGIPAKKLFEKTELVLLPMVNPDGVDLVMGNIDKTGKYYRRAREMALSYPEIPFPSGWKANINGVDLNLNYPARWEEAKTIKYALGYTCPGPRDFVGETPLSQPESKALYDLTRKNDFSLILAYHTQGEVIYWQREDMDIPHAWEIGRALESVSGYTLEAVPQESANAGYRDWFVLGFKRPGFTVEAGWGENPLPIEDFDSMYERNKCLIAEGLKGSFE